MSTTIVSVDQMDQRQIIVKLSDGTEMQFDLEELAMMFDYQINNRDDRIQCLRIHRVQ